MHTEKWKQLEDSEGWLAGRTDPHRRDLMDLIEEGRTLIYIKAYKEARDFMQWTDRHLYAEGA